MSVPIKRHLVWWIVVGLLALAWIPFGLDAISRPMDLRHGQSAENMYRIGFWLLVWWPCNVFASLIILFKFAKWVIKHFHRRGFDHL